MPIQQTARPLLLGLALCCALTSPLAAEETACIEDVGKDLASRLTDFEGAPVPPEDVIVASLPDLDGDGHTELLYTGEGACGTSGNCVYVLYLSGNGCLRFAGTLGAQLESVEVLESEHEGLRDLRVFGDDGCAGREGTVESLRWNGSAYEVASRVECSCPDDEPAGTPRDPLCPP